MTDSAVRIAVLLPDLLGTYGDRGNALVLANRLHQRGYRHELLDVYSDQPIPTGCDIYLLGGGEDLAQHEAVRVLDASRFHIALDNHAVVLAVCAGLQLLGTTMIDTNDHRHAGLGLLDVVTTPRQRRAIGEVVTHANPTLDLPDPLLTGFENHRGNTELGPTATPLATVHTGVGNGDGTEGAIHGRIIGTYLHGPVLARNPALADHLLTLATGQAQPPIHLPEQTAMRDSAIKRATKSQSALRKTRHWLTPHQWTTPGIR